MKQQTLLIITLALIGLFPFTLSAQMIINVESVGPIKGNLANFELSNPCEIDSIFAPIRIVNDHTEEIFACDTFIDNELSGKFALIYHDYDCPFDLQSANVEANGAIGVIICNDEPWRRPIGPNYNNPIQVSIPTILISRQDCIRLTTALDEFTEIPASFYFDNISNPPNRIVYWGDQAGQGEFDGGLNGWTVENCTVENNDTIIDPDPVTWLWYDNPIEERFSSQMVSYSRCNGAVGFEATQWNIDNGDLSNPNNYPNHHCELISPIIDLSDARAVSLQFWQVNFGLNGNDNPGAASMRVFISIDGGISYPEQIDIGSGNVLTADAIEWGNAELIRFFLPHLAGESNIRLKFEYHSDFYAWYIDDVYFTGMETKIAVLNPDLYGFPNSARTPDFLVEPFIPISHVYQQRFFPDTNDFVQIDIAGPINHSTRFHPGYFHSDTLIVKCSGNEFLPESHGKYQVHMELHVDSMDYSENTFDYEFETTCKVWSKSPGAINTKVRAGDARNFVWGSVFHVPESYSGNASINGFNLGFELLDSIDALDQFISWSLIEWDNENSDDICQRNERSIIETGIVDFSYRDGIDGETQYYSLETLENNNPIVIQADKTYILSVTWNNPDRSLSIFGYRGLNYTGTKLANTECHGNNRFVDVIGVGNDDIDGDWSTKGWASGVVPAFELIFDLTDHDCTDVANLEANSYVRLEIFPNPASEHLWVSVESNISLMINSLEIIDITGHIVIRKNKNLMNTSKYHFDLSSLRNGIYFLKVNTNVGIKVKKIIVNH